MRPLCLFDTYTRSLRTFEPLQPPEVGIYTCGPTVYDYAHVGNLRTYIFEDLLRRVLEFNGYRVKQVMNITDVGHLVSDADTGEDKMEKGSRRMGQSAWEIAEMYTQAFKHDLQLLNIQEPHIWCRATDHIKEQIEFIKRIEAKRYTYRTRDGIYFDTSKLPDYGYLARLDVEGLEAGARVHTANKRHPTDFALWKFSPRREKRQMEWKSPWGTGFPGWHIECSAMAARYLGPFFDIHCGGEDHIMVHHPNEIAQTQAVHGTRLANFWVHGYFLMINHEKVAKSKGEPLRLQTLIDNCYDPLAWRFFCLGANYRAKLNFCWEALDGAMAGLSRLRTITYEWGAPGEPEQGYIDRFVDHINDDLNIPCALALAWELAKSDLPAPAKKATMLEFDRVFGLDLATWEPSIEAVPDEVLALIEQREQARAAKAWQEADALRKQVRAAGYEIDDTPEGPRARPCREKVDNT